MDKFDFPFYDTPEPERAKVTPIVGGEVTPEEEEQAFKDLFKELFGGRT